MQKYAFFLVSQLLVHGGCATPDEGPVLNPSIATGADRESNLEPTGTPEFGAASDSGVSRPTDQEGAGHEAPFPTDGPGSGGPPDRQPAAASAGPASSGAGAGLDDDGAPAAAGAPAPGRANAGPGDGSGSAGAPLARGGWLCNEGALVFEDEFDTMDWDAWAMKCTNAMVREAECKQENVTAQSGELQIRTRRIGNTNNFSSAGIVSREGWLTAGRTVCFDAKLPGARGAGNGLWPALWFMPKGGECWPYGGEIDLLEMVNADGEVHNVYHYIRSHTPGVTAPNCGNLDNKGEIHVTTPTRPEWFDEYHEYAVRMTEDTIIFYLDGAETMRIQSGDQQAHIHTDNAWMMQINTAVGGAWPKPPDASTVSDTSFKIRSVKVVDSSQLEDPAPPQCVERTVVDAIKCGTSKLIDAAKCGTHTVTSAAECGIETVTSAAQCGLERVTDAARCGTHTVTSAAECGVRTVTSAASCGYERVTDGARCGWDIISSWLGLREAKSCSVAATCTVTNSCQIANSCDVAASCDVARTCQLANECEIPETCDVEVCSAP